MKDRPGAILRLPQEQYLERLLPPREPLLAEMEQVSRDEGVPSSDPEVGRLLEALAGGAKAERILEVGTGIGYGTLCLARGAPEARVASIDADEERLARARDYLARGGVGERVELFHGPALEILPTLEGPFDLVYLDAVKKEYRRYLDLTLPLLRVGGMVVVDNLLWKGHIAEPGEGPEDDPDADAIEAFNPYFMIHPQLRSVVLPLGDGVGLATKLRPTMREMGGPF